MIETSIRVDPEFKSLIPPLTPEEYKQLEENILAEGIRDPLVVWDLPNGDMILLDGHNRFEIAAKHGGLPFEVKKMRFADHDRERAKLWIIRNQLGRRNLDAWKKFDLTRQLEEVEGNLAKSRHGARTDLAPTLAESHDFGDARDKMAAHIGVSHGTYDKMKYIDQHGTPEQNQQVREGKMTTNQAWLEIKERERKQEDMSARAHLEKATQRHEDLQTAPIVSIDDIKQDREDIVEIADSKRREIDNAIKKILFIGAGMSNGETDFSIISKRTIGADGIKSLISDIGRAIDVLQKMLNIISKEQ